MNSKKFSIRLTDKDRDDLDYLADVMVERTTAAVFKKMLHNALLHFKAKEMGTDTGPV